jgi:hypothetical protein
MAGDLQIFDEKRCITRKSKASRAIMAYVLDMDVKCKEM